MKEREREGGPAESITARRCFTVLRSIATDVWQAYGKSQGHATFPCSLGLTRLGVHLGSRMPLARQEVRSHRFTHDS